MKNLWNKFAAACLRFEAWMDGKKRNTSLVLGWFIGLAEWCGNEFQIKAPWFYHTIHLVAYVATSLGLYGIASSIQKKKGQAA